MQKIIINVRNIDMKEDIISFVYDKSLPFSVTMCGISYCDGSYEMHRKNSDVSVIEYILSGCGTVSVNGKSFCAEKDDIYFLKKGEDQLYYSDSENPWIKIWMNFSGTLSDSITECHNLSDIHLFHAPNLKKYFFDIYKIARSGGNVKDVSEKCANVFLIIAQKLADVTIEENRSKYGIAQKAKAYIDEKNYFSMNLDDSAASLSYSKNHIIRAFKQQYKITPYEYMQNRRFSIAESLLKNSAYSVSEIAEKLSFCDVRYFSTCFSKKYGASPTEYRKRLAKST